MAEGTWVSVILFADNYWLVATSAKMLKQMTEKWLDLMAEYVWETPVADLAWCSTAKDNESTQFKIRGKNTLRAAAADGFKVPGNRRLQLRRGDRVSLIAGEQRLLRELGTPGVRERPSQNEATRL